MKTFNTSCTDNKSKSPKTPGGITKTLLTPCRRVGLSRRWKQSSKSPFISPVSRNNESISSVEIDSTPNNCKKKRNDGENHPNEYEIINDVNSDNTPSRTKESNKIKKTRSIVKKILCEEDNLSDQQSYVNDSHADLEKPLLYLEDSTMPTYNSIENESDVISQTKIDVDSVETHLKTTGSVVIEIQSSNVPTARKLSRNRSNNTLKKVFDEQNKIDILSETLESNNIILNEPPNNPVNTKLPKKKSLKSTSQKKCPNNLTNECIVVLGRTILKDNNKPSQPLFESEVDDIPLSHVSKLKQNKNIEAAIITIEDDDDFIEKPTKSQKLKKLEDKKTSTGDLRKLTVIKKLPTKEQLSQNTITSFEDDDDFVETRNKILRRTYNKTAKPIRAKTTGSITQRDIDDLKARIEIKRQMLLVKTDTKDTKELRVLIKKWRKGCQEALTELMDIMKKKFPDKHNMDLSELLEMLKIPSDLVGYDDDHDCFQTPEEVDCLFNVQV